MPVQPRLHIENLQSFRRQLRKVDSDLVKEMGQVHKSIGEMVIARLGGKKTGVGEGRGSTIRPSAATREVLLRVGGSHRSDDPRRKQWGKRQKFPGGRAPHRPYLIQTALEMHDQIEDAYLDGIDRIARKAGMK